MEVKEKIKENNVKNYVPNATTDLVSDILVTSVKPNAQFITQRYNIHP